MAMARKAGSSNAMYRRVHNRRRPWERKITAGSSANRRIASRCARSLRRTARSAPRFESAFETALKTSRISSPAAALKAANVNRAMGQSM
jgi:hypothetical protein